jgi:hypothetical protein
MMWAYKCDATLTALGIHADAAAVNVNFWITEDEANLDPEQGGLLVYTEDAPREWGFAKFNTDRAAIERHLAASGAVPLRVPYRSNRAVLFDSDLFHASDRPRFREGYVHRRHQHHAALRPKGLLNQPPARRASCPGAPGCGAVRTVFRSFW